MSGMVPGNEWLDVALSALGTQTLLYSKFLSRSTNSIGQDVSVYDTPVSLEGSFQPVAKGLYDQYGLDLSKTYFTFFVSYNAFPVDRDISGDQFEINGEIFKCESTTNWYGEDGWKELLLVQINK